MNKLSDKAVVSGLLFLLIMLNFKPSLFSQEVSGLWEVEKVSVGDEEMTPQSKWMKLEPTGKFFTGNGWLQTGSGNWNIENGSIRMIEKDGLYDPFGPFSVDLQDEKMIWGREEEGAQVHIFLKRVDDLPKGPADQVTGIWKLTTFYRDSIDKTAEFDSTGKFFLFLRWDRIYVGRDQNGQRQTGYWHMNGHRPELTLLPHAESEEPATWTVSVSGDDLLLTGMSAKVTGQRMILTRTDRLPD